MDTPICDFVARYQAREPLRFHMPGHKGKTYLGCEPWDITEISGADSLYEADGIIRKSEENAGKLFGAGTYYSTEGSSQAIRAMIRLVCLYAGKQGRRPLIWAGRNAHSAFLSATALMDCPVEWLYPQCGCSYLSCSIDAEGLEQALRTAKVLPTAVYVTSPDYLGNQQDIAALARACHACGVLLLVDNAHGAYLKFLTPSQHPMDLGADLCCDSAHKTLPVLTGGAYLHFSPDGPPFAKEEVREALRLFGSTSPSYLILQSLDRANLYLEQEFPGALRDLLPKLRSMKERLSSHGYELIGTESLKLTISTRSRGYLGTELAELLEQENIIAEFADPDNIVFMLAPSMGAEYLERLTQALLLLPRRESIPARPPALPQPVRVLDIRTAMLAPSELLPVEQCCGRILAQASVGCPPAVPIVVSGEVVNGDAIRCFLYYGIRACRVVR